jgi:hypothetical protein
MENESRVARFFRELGEKLNEQVWFQQLKSKWDELDPQSRLYLRYAATAGAMLLAVGLVFSSWLSVRGLKKELAEKNDLLVLIQSANDEMRRLKDAVPRAATGGRPGETPDAPWPAYLESTASTAGIDKSVLTVGAEKAGASSDQAKESLIDLQLKRVSIKQVVRYAFYLENGARPVKLRNLAIDTQGDPEGYMNATLSVSAFSLKQ